MAAGAIRIHDGDGGSSPAATMIQGMPEAAAWRQRCGRKCGSAFVECASDGPGQTAGCAPYGSDSAAQRTAEKKEPCRDDTRGNSAAGSDRLRREQDPAGLRSGAGATRGAGEEWQPAADGGASNTTPENSSAIQPRMPMNQRIRRSRKIQLRLPASRGRNENLRD